ncbi:MAG: hypothetical protein ACRD0H_29235 [Actinomycetes bacterium]
MSGRVLTSSATVDIATDRSVYGRAFLVAAVELGMTFSTPSTALLQAWAAIPPEARALLELFLDAPAVVIEDLVGAPALRRLPPRRCDCCQAVRERGRVGCLPDLAPPAVCFGPPRVWTSAR